MKGFVMKASMSEMISLGEGGDERVGGKVFLARGCREKKFVIKESRIKRWFWRSTEMKLGVWCPNTTWNGDKA